MQHNIVFEINIALLSVLPHSTYSGKVFRVTLISVGGFLILPLMVVILILESPIQPEVFR